MKEHIDFKEEVNKVSVSHRKEMLNVILKIYSGAISKDNPLNLALIFI